MFYIETSKNNFAIRLKKEESLVDSVLQFCQKNNIDNATLNAIGALKDPVLTYYNLPAKKYQNKEFKGEYELASLTGNIALLDNKPLLHAHMVISDEKMNAFGGHLVRAQVAATVEIFMSKLPTAITRKKDTETNLNLLILPHITSPHITSEVLRS
jgi:uncharacterized protein